MTAYPCAGCGRLVVVEHVLCVDCERSLDPTPIVPRLRLDDADRMTKLDALTLIFDGPAIHNRSLPSTVDLDPAT